MEVHFNLDAAHAANAVAERFDDARDVAAALDATAAPVAAAASPRATARTLLIGAVSLLAVAIAALKAVFPLYWALVTSLRPREAAIGDLWLPGLTFEPTIAACVAAEPTDVIAFDRTKLRHMTAKWPEFAEHVLRTMTARRTWLETHGIGVLRLIAPRGSNRAFQVRDLLGLGIRLLVGASELVLGLPLALLLPSFTAQRWVVGEVPGRLLEAAADLVEDAHEFGLPQRGLGQAPAQLLDRVEDRDRAGIAQLLLGEAAGEHRDGLHARPLGRLAVPGRVADHHR